eukprot:TRINITY_DN144619_c0_g1_i1.p2 TRINITY_DN144619_c0_g1~~TRINITY_DN144619_c0_g1_i1.p2  ORF type:complete len:110 (-),score=1.88 TRINITY_DN144619_c0_g1_i1:30-359(-)
MDVSVCPNVFALRYDLWFFSFVFFVGAVVNTCQDIFTLLVGVIMLLELKLAPCGKTDTVAVTTDLINAHLFRFQADLNQVIALVETVKTRVFVMFVAAVLGELTGCLGI